MDNLNFLTTLNKDIFSAPVTTSPATLVEHTVQSIVKKETFSASPLTKDIVDQLLGCKQNVDCFIHNLGLFKIDLKHETNKDLVKQLVERAVDLKWGDILIELLATDIGVSAYKEYSSGKPTNDFFKYIDTYLHEPLKRANASAAPAAPAASAAPAAPAASAAKDKTFVNYVWKKTDGTLDTLIIFIGINKQQTDASKAFIIHQLIQDHEANKVLKPGDKLIKVNETDITAAEASTQAAGLLWQQLHESHKTTDLTLTFERTQGGGRRKRTFKNKRRRM